MQRSEAEEPLKVKHRDAGRQKEPPLSRHKQLLVRPVVVPEDKRHKHSTGTGSR